MTRTRRIEKIGALYRRMEQMHERELHGATAAVSAIVGLQAQEVAAHRGESSHGRAALECGDTEEWLLAEAGRDLIGLRMPRHRELEGRLEQQRLLAAASHRESRIQREQMERLAEAKRREVETLEARRMQAATDDRFLSRRTWLRGAYDAGRMES